MTKGLSQQHDNWSLPNCVIKVGRRNFQHEGIYTSGGERGRGNRGEKGIGEGEEG